LVACSRNIGYNQVCSNQRPAPDFVTPVDC
jgi:hypothetical protein